VSGTVKVASHCGCVYTVDKHQRETVVSSCMEHEREWIQRHVEAVSSCSHVHRERNNDLVS
jgi:hypothetical protein